MDLPKENSKSLVKCPAIIGQEHQQQCASTDISNDEKHLIKPSLKRYIVLLLFCISSGNKSFQWIQIPASSDKVTAFYNVNNYAINFASTIFMLSFIFLSWPACYLIKRVGIRRAVLLASFIALLGSSIKCFSCQSNRIYLLFISQTLVSIGEQLIFSVPSRLASVWFPDDQVSSAVSLMVFGNYLGVALGFLAPHVFLDGAIGSDAIGSGLYNMFLATAALSLFAFIANVLLFDEAPKLAPGLARSKQIQVETRGSSSSSEHTTFLQEMRQLTEQISDLLHNRHYLCLAISFGINQGFTNAIYSLLNQMIEPHWPGNLQVIGNAGFFLVFGGTLLSPFWGKLLDALHLYLWINWGIGVANIGALIIFGYVLSSGLHSEMLIYISALLLGAFQTGFCVAGLELAVELTYPAPELVTTSFMNIMPQIFGVMFTFIGSHIVDQYGAIAVNLFFLASLTVALILQLTIKENLKRQDAVLDEEVSSEFNREREKRANSSISNGRPQVELVVTPVA